MSCSDSWLQPRRCRCSRSRSCRCCRGFRSNHRRRLPSCLMDGGPPWNPAGRRYYYNKSLNTSTYDMPEANSPPLPPPPAPSSVAPAPSSVASNSQQASQSSVPCYTLTTLASQSSAPCYTGSYTFGSFEAEQRRGRITFIKAYLCSCENRSEKAELQGELAVLQREEHLYIQSQDPLAARLFQ